MNWLRSTSPTHAGRALILGSVIGLAAIACLLSRSARADEGMWTFDNFPSAAVKAKYGVDVDQAWLDHVRGAAVRLSTGCSASIVTASGIVLSNHHCVRDCAQQLSSATQNYAQDGFLATRREDEKTCAGMVAEVLDGIKDVTGRVTAAGAGKSGEAFVKALDAQVAAVEKEGCAGKEDKYRCQVVTLYQGGKYELYTYRKYTDVRLVFAPEGQMAFFGGDPDNFNFPRYDLDCSFVRLYENGKPAATADHLIWSNAPPKEGAPLFIVGNPGTTQRQLTADQLVTLRDLRIPETLILLSELRGQLQRFTSESAEHARIANAVLFDIENDFKNYHGQEQALVDPTLIAAKRAADRELKARVTKDPKLAAQIGDPWGDIAKAQVHIHELYLPYIYLEPGAGFLSDLFGYARDLVRVAQERPKANSERLREYTDSRLALLEKTLLDPQPVYPELEQLKLEFWLSKVRENLTADSPHTRLFLGKDSPQTLAARLATSKLGDPAIRKALWDGGLAAVQASNDPLIRYVLATDADSRALRKRYEGEVAGPIEQAQQKIGRARFAAYGTSVYPDATFTVRVSYGKVAGWTNDGVKVPAFTYFSGLWERATGQAPFALSPRWQNAQAKVDPHTVFDFVSDNDIVGGNSGSPAIDAEGHVVGAVFDGNILSLGGPFGFDNRVNRAVSVSTASITEALRNIYGAQALVTELTAQD
jgi:hypothetical protein